MSGAKTALGLTRGLMRILEEAMTFQKRKTQGKKDLNKFEFAILKAYAGARDVAELQAY